MKKTIWALLDDRMGSVGQARGVLEALGDDYATTEKKVVYNKLANLPNFLLGASFLGVNKKESSSFEGPYPDIILSISRRTTPIARKIKKLSNGKSKIVQLMYPGKCGLDDLDLVVVPKHDRLHKIKNALYITGCPHKASLKALAEAREKWEPVFANLPRPLTAVIVGGAIKGKPFSLENAVAFANCVREIKQKIGGAILITTSRRTGDEAQKAIMKILDKIPAYTFLWGEKKENPYMGFLACADNIIVTGDTVSMCSDSCGTKLPVWVFSGKDWLTPKHHRFVQSLFDGGYAISIDNPQALEFVPKQRLDPSAEIADKINALFACVK